eukprot:4508811-Alexandrium_andersonii.AAC.1
MTLYGSELGRGHGPRDISKGFVLGQKGPACSPKAATARPRRASRGFGQPLTELPAQTFPASGVERIAPAQQ